MNNLLKTGSDILYMTRRTSAMASITIDQTIVPTAQSNVMKSNVTILNDIIVTEPFFSITDVNKDELKS